MFSGHRAAAMRHRWQISATALVREHAYGVGYRVEASLDGGSWATLWSTSAGTGGTVTITEKTAARYVRVCGTKRAGTDGGSLIGFEIR